MCVCFKIERSGVLLRSTEIFMSDYIQVPLTKCEVLRFAAEFAEK